MQRPGLLPKCRRNFNLSGVDLKFGFLLFENNHVKGKKERGKKYEKEEWFVSSFSFFFAFCEVSSFFYLLYFTASLFFLHGSFPWSMNIKLEIILGFSFWLLSTAFLWTMASWSCSVISLIFLVLCTGRIFLILSYTKPWTFDLHNLPSV